MTAWESLKQSVASATKSSAIHWWCLKWVPTARESGVEDAFSYIPVLALSFGILSNKVNGSTSKSSSMIVTNKTDTTPNNVMPTPTISILTGFLQGKYFYDP